MKIKILKEGAYSFSPIGQPMVNFDEDDIGRVVSVRRIMLEPNGYLNNTQAMELVEDNWAEISEAEEDEIPDPEVEEETEEEVDEEDEEEGDEVDEGEEDGNDIPDLDAHLRKLIKDKTEDEAKQLLKDFAMVELNVNISKALKIDNMIAKMIEAKENGDGEE